MKAMHSLAVIGMLAMVSAASAETTFTNPIVKQRADPHVFLHTDGYYYFVATVPEYDRIELRRAKTIQELGTAEAKTVWTKHATGPMGSHIWAPEVHFIDGKWYIYFAAGAADKVWDIRIYALENESANPLEGKWTEKGKINTGWESFALDATTFTNDGKLYLVWAQHDDKLKINGKNGNTNLYIAQMDTPVSITGKAVMISKPDLPWEQVGYMVNEGPAILKHGGKLFLTYSASATDANYCMGMLTADAKSDPLDPKSWTKSQTPVLKTDETLKVFGPGHNAFTTSPDGKEDILMYHARDYAKITGDPLKDANRATRALVIHYDADGVPVFKLEK